MGVIQLRHCTLDEILSAREYAFQERQELLCKCGCRHPHDLCQCPGEAAPDHEYEPSGVRVEVCFRCDLPNVPDHPCR